MDDSPLDDFLQDAASIADGVAFETADGATYRLRPATAGDIPQVTALHNTVWHGGHDEDWFRWKYLANPYVGHVPAVVATHGDTVVGVCGALPFHVRRGDRTGLATLDGDLVVHPDHRRHGLFRALSTFSIRAYTVGAVPDADRPDFAFAYANEQSRPGMESMGWERVAPRISYRLTIDPTPFLADKLGPTAAALAPLGRAGARTYQRARRRLHDVAQPADIDVERRDDAPPGLLADLADHAHPDTVHPVLDESFYRWRYGGPLTPDGVFLAHRDSNPVAALLVRLDERDTATTLSLAHVTPLTGDAHWQRAVATLVDTALDAYPEADFARAWNPTYPTSLLTDRGFLPDDRLPLSLLTGPDLTLETYAFDWSAFDSMEIRESGDYLWTLDG